MAYSTLEQRETLQAWLAEHLGRTDVFAGALHWNRERTRDGAYGSDMFQAISMWVLMETNRGLQRAGYRSFRDLKVWDAWTDTRWIGNVDWLAAKGGGSEQFKTVLGQIGDNVIRLELLRWRRGNEGCFYRVEGMVGPGPGSLSRVVSFA